MASRVLFLCTGNTCRSPLVESVATQQFADLEAHFESAGLKALSGQPAADHSVTIAREMGMDLTDHRSRLVSRGLLDEVSWVIGLTRSHATIFRSRFGETFAGAIGLLGAPGVDLTLVPFSPDCDEVDDPFGGSLEGYRDMGRQIAGLLPAWTSVFSNL